MANYSNGNGSSMSDLERQAETTRAELAQTVDELHSRVAPDALKRDAKNYALQTGQQLLGSIEAKARENPLAAVAVAAGLAFPLWRMLSNMPAPVLLIGAGVALSRRGSSVSAANTTGLRSAAEGQSLGDRASGLARSIGDKATDVIEDTQYKAEVMGSRVAEAVSGTLHTTQDMASHAASVISDTTVDMSRQAADKLDRARGSIIDTIERHPLLIGGLAFAIGGLVASSLPVTRSENRLMGSASDGIKNRAKDIADEGVDVLQTAAAEVYEEVAVQTRTQGLTPGTARGAVKSAMEHAGAVIDKATKAVEAPGSTSVAARPIRKQKIINSENDNG